MFNMKTGRFDMSNTPILLDVTEKRDNDNKVIIVERYSETRIVNKPELMLKTSTKVTIELRKDMEMKRVNCGIITEYRDENGNIQYYATTPYDKDWHGLFWSKSAAQYLLETIAYIYN